MQVINCDFHRFPLMPAGSLTCCKSRDESSQNIPINNVTSNIQFYMISCEANALLYVCRFLVHRRRYDPSETELCVPLIYLSS